MLGTSDRLVGWAVVAGSYRGPALGGRRTSAGRGDRAPHGSQGLPSPGAAVLSGLRPSPAVRAQHLGRSGLLHRGTREESLARDPGHPTRTCRRDQARRRGKAVARLWHIAVRGGVVSGACPVSRRRQRQSELVPAQWREALRLRARNPRHLLHEPGIHVAQHPRMQVVVTGILPQRHIHPSGVE